MRAIKAIVEDPAKDPLIESTDKKLHDEKAYAESRGCVSCHTTLTDPHEQSQVGCVACHGGNGYIHVSIATPQRQPEYAEATIQSPRAPAASRKTGRRPRTRRTRWQRSSTSRRSSCSSSTPGDLRVAQVACGKCHEYDPATKQDKGSIVSRVKTSIMSTGAMLWGAALYNNGCYPLKNYRYGEVYTADGQPARINAIPPPTMEETWSWAGCRSWIRCRGGKFTQHR